MNNNKDNCIEENNGISPEQVEQTIKELSHLIIKSGDEKFLYDFFLCLFTQPELKDIANRWLLVKEIDKGSTQRESSKELSKSDSAFRKMLELLKDNSNKI